MLVFLGATASGLQSRPLAQSQERDVIKFKVRGAGMIWTVVSRFAIQDASVEQFSSKQGLLCGGRFGLGTLS